MITIDDLEVYGFKAAIRGMRNPMNSWEKSDTVVYSDCDYYDVSGNSVNTPLSHITRSLSEDFWELSSGVKIGPEDEKLMRSLIRGGSVHAKFRRMICVSMDITAPLYWWKEFDTYKVGTVANSCSTMHKIAEKEFTLADFSCEHLGHYDPEKGEDQPYIDTAYEESDEIYGYGGPVYPIDILTDVILMLNHNRKKFIETKDKKYWWQLIQLLPSSYNQKRTVTMNYEVLSDIYPSRKDHKLDEWRTFCVFMKECLPYSWIFTGEEKTE